MTKQKPLFSFGITTDIQYADIPDDDRFSDRYFRLSLHKLHQAVSYFNKHKLEFVINLGDTIDQDFDNFDKILPVFEHSKAPVWQAVGNHDFCKPEYVYGEDKDKVLKKLSLDHSYYAKTVKNWRFIIIDSNEIGVIEHPKGTKEHDEGAEYLEKKRQEGAYNAMFWNGALSKAQLDWVIDELKAARAHNQHAIIFSHHPIYPEHRENLLNDKEVLEKITKFPNLKAFICGHNHDGNYGKYQNLHVLNIHGMVDTKENAFALAHVYEDRIEIEGHGRETDRTLVF